LPNRAYAPQGFEAALDEVKIRDLSAISGYTVSGLRALALVRTKLSEVHAAEKLRHRWIGIDVTRVVISLIEKRRRDAFPDLRHQAPKTVHILSMRCDTWWLICVMLWCSRCGVRL
jgi:hypothetical protein